MTVDEKRTRLAEHCDTNLCEKCPLEMNNLECAWITRDDDSTNSAYAVIFGNPPEEVVEEPLADVIKHPSHYCREGAMECIDEMVMIFGKEAVKHFCLLNIWKYRYRSGAKNGTEDIEKSDRYVQIYKELCNG